VGRDRPTHSSLTATSCTWLNNKKGDKRMYQALAVAKHRAVRPAVDKILRVGNPSMQAAVLRAIIDHPSLATPRKIAGIDSSKQQATANFLCQQSACLLSHNRRTENKRGNTTADQRNAAEAVFTFTAPSLDKMVGIPSKREHARVMGVPRTTLQRIHKKGTKKCCQLTARERDVYWSRAQRSRKGYIRIGDDLCSLLIAAVTKHERYNLS